MFVREGTSNRHLFRSLVLGIALGLGGCATPGPLHVYSLRDDGAGGERPVLDLGPARTVDVPSFLETDERISGFAYDPFTDHFFLCLNPGNRIRVVDRPARAIKRELVIAGASETTGGDLAVRPRDGHLFLLQPPRADVLETTRFGKIVRTVVLAGVSATPAGIAFDAARNQLLALSADGGRVTVHDLAGARLGEVTLERAGGFSLAFDAEKRELYAPLRAHPGGIGVFDERGKLVRTLDIMGALVDVGPRSFVRVF